MMCLGWDNNPICQPAPDTVQITAPAITPAAIAVACPDIDWFWISLALVAGGALLKGVAR